MKFVRLVAAVAALWSGGAGLALAQGTATAQRLYVLDCGQGRVADQSRWSPGVNVGQPLDFADNCYLIRHARGWLLWDTGIPEAVAALPDGQSGAGGATVWRRPKTMASQLAEIGVAPGEIGLVAVSHTHGDHVGNVDMFDRSIVLIQRKEYEWAFAKPDKPYSPAHASRLLDGDLDVFGDGSVLIVSTPGHTPGHQSLLVKLPATGVVVLTGDAVHFRSNWENRRVPSLNVDRELTLVSLDRLAALLAEHKGQLWINHDKPQSDAMKRVPAFYD